MTLDERLEALTQSLELLSHLHQELATQTDARLSKVLDIVERLAAAVESHERRLGHLEGN